MRDGSLLPAKSSTEQNEGLIFWAGEHKTPGEGHGLQRQNKAESAVREMSVETGPYVETLTFCLQEDKARRWATPREL